MNEQNIATHLGGGGEEPSASSGFFWPTGVFFRGAFDIIPEVLAGI
jgi:hypothetical protein